MREADKNTWINIYNKSITDHRVLFVAYGVYYNMFWSNGTVFR
jgi:hypothetical protein